MNQAEISRVLNATDKVRKGGSKAERETALFLAEECIKRGITVVTEEFDMPVTVMRSASLTADGKSVRCEGVENCGSGIVEAPFVYLPKITPESAKSVNGKIVMTDVYFPRYFNYIDLADAGAVGLIVHNGGRYHSDEDIDRKEMREFTLAGRRKMLAVCIHANDAVRLVRDDTKKVCITVDEETTSGKSQNVIAEIPGTTDEWIVMTAHYDTTFLSHGQYDNISGCISLLHTIDEIKKLSGTKRGIRIIFCGSEERGLMGAKAYTKTHRAELDKIALCVNVDMIGSIMGHFLITATAEEKLVHHVASLCDEYGEPSDVKQGVYSSDSTPFADAGVPAISFARYSPLDWGMIHSRYDTSEMLSSDRIIKDCNFISGFVIRMANAEYFPVSREMPDKLKRELDEYLGRRRKGS